MDEIRWTIIFKCVFIVLAGIALLRLSGRKSISQMTVATTVIMISIGSLLAQGIVEKTVWRSVISVTLFLAVLVFLEYLVVKFRMMERWVAGMPEVVIRDGQVDERVLTKIRMSKSQLEMRLRQKGIQHLADVQTATIEINGELGYELRREAKPFTVGDFEAWISTRNPAPGQAQPALDDKERAPAPPGYIRH